MADQHCLNNLQTPASKPDNGRSGTELTGDDRERVLGNKIQFLRQDPNIVRLMDRLSANNK